MPSSADRVAPLAERLQSAARVTLLTGAGVSVASGIPTFRGTNGLWRRHRPESLATPEAFAKDPKLVWEWYVWRRRKVAACKPNLAHEVIAAWSRRYPAFSLITQNVDGLHELAGTTNVLRMHGSLWEMSCWDQCAGSPGRWEDRRDRARRAAAPLPALRWASSGRASSGSASRSTRTCCANATPRSTATSS